MLSADHAHLGVVLVTNVLLSVAADSSISPQQRSGQSTAASEPLHSRQR